MNIQFKCPGPACAAESILVYRDGAEFMASGPPYCPSCDREMEPRPALSQQIREQRTETSAADLEREIAAARGELERIRAFRDVNALIEHAAREIARLRLAARSVAPAAAMHPLDIAGRWRDDQARALHIDEERVHDALHDEGYRDRREKAAEWEETMRQNRPHGKGAL